MNSSKLITIQHAFHSKNILACIKYHFSLNLNLEKISIYFIWLTLQSGKRRVVLNNPTCSRLEKLQRLAEKVHQEAKVTDSKLDDIEAWIEDEAKRVDHLHPKDAKNNCDQVKTPPGCR